MSDPDPRYFVEAIARTLKVLETLSGEQRGMTVPDIAAAACMDRTTALRVLYTMEHLSYIERDPETKRYSLGATILSQGLAVLRSSDMIARARPFVAGLFAACGETTDLVVRDRVNGVIVAMYDAHPLLNVYYHLGASIPIHCSATGKALLSDFTPSMLRDLLGPGPYMRYGPNSITQYEELVAELASVRRKGYAIADAEVDSNLRAVGVPIRDAKGAVVASLSITVTTDRMSREDLEARMVPMAVAAAAHISQALGAPVGTDPNYRQGAR